MKIFLNYRRSDNPHATDRVVDQLVREFGRENVFYDIDSIPIGVNWRTHIADSVSQCDVFLAAVGDNWLAELRQREGTKDLVRSEVESALKRGVPIVPLLLGHSEFPSREDLPNDIAQFADWNGLQLRPGLDFQTDMRRLIDRLKEFASALRSLEPPKPESSLPGSGRSTPGLPTAGRITSRKSPYLDIRKIKDVTLVTLRSDAIFAGERHGVLRDGLTNLASGGSARIVLNLEKVHYFTSMAMQELIGGYRRVRLAGGDLRLCGLNPEVRDLFRITRLDMMFRVDETVDAAIDALRGNSGD
jgi:anti-anti-sigma factor